MIRRLIASLAFAASSAFAAGPYDGVYAFTSVNSSTLLSVHQNGSTLLVVTLSQRANTLGSLYPVAPRFTVVPTVNQVWEYAIGTLNGQEATVNNPGAFYGACSVDMRVNFNGLGGMTLTPLAGTTTAVGTANGVSCNAALTSAFGNPGTSFSLVKAF
jgi:hypothetical protein